MKSIHQIFQGNEHLMDLHPVEELIDYCQELEGEVMERRIEDNYDKGHVLKSMLKDIRISIDETLAEDEESIRFDEIPRVDFKEAINNGSIFAIITARGHNPKIIKEGVYNYIINNFEGIDKKTLLKNLKKYRDFVGEEEMTDEELIRSYLELNKYNPVSFGEGSAANPEELKVTAMEDFVRYVKSMAALLQKSAILKKDIANKFSPRVPLIGFSDDDIKNVDVMKKHFDKIKEPIKVYSTKGGIKKEY